MRGAHRVGERLEARLASGRRVRRPSPVSPGPDSSYDDGEYAGCAGGSFSPGAMVRVGKGGSLPLQSPKEFAVTGRCEVCGQCAYIHAVACGERRGDIISGVSSGVVRREGRRRVECRG